MPQRVYACIDLGSYTSVTKSRNNTLKNNEKHYYLKDSIVLM